MSGARNPFAIFSGESPQSEETEVWSTKEEAFFDPPTDASTLSFYIVVRDRPREASPWSEVFSSLNIETAKKYIVDTIFGTGLPNTPDELLERYNLVVVEYDDDWKNRLLQVAS